MIAFQFFHPIVCESKIQIYVSNIQICTVLSQTISKLMCKLAWLNKWKSLQILEFDISGGGGVNRDECLFIILTEGEGLIKEGGLIERKKNRYCKVFSNFLAC